MSAAAREVGVSRSAANIWKNGTTVRRKDGTVKVVHGLSYLPSVSSRPTPLGGGGAGRRPRIARLSLTAIGAVPGRAPSTISRELFRAADAVGASTRLRTD